MTVETGEILIITKELYSIKKKDPNNPSDTTFWDIYLQVIVWIVKLMIHTI